MSPAAPMLRRCAAFFPLLLAVLPAVLAASAGEALAQTLQSRTRTGEFDTAEQPGGQAGGLGGGYNFSLLTLRCAAGETIVGARIRRGDVLDHIQIACARPVCAANSCQWATPSWGMAAGNPGGGDGQPPMLCGRDQAVSGFQARVIAFGRLDYVADIQIQCARIAAAPDANGFTAVQAGSGQWRHSQGGTGGGTGGALARGTIPRNATRNVVGSPISCQQTGAASALSTATSNHFARRNQRVVQAMSLFCPRQPPAQRQAPDPRCPDRLVVAHVAAQDDIVERDWFSRGGRTGGGMVATMSALPAERNYQGVQVTERVQYNAANSNCPMANAAAICGTGRNEPFAVDQSARGANQRVNLGSVGISVPWSVPQNATPNGSFPDTHAAFDVAAAGRPAGLDMLGNLPGQPQQCRITCTQTYHCGAGANQATYGPFTILYIFTRDTFQPTVPGVLPIPTGGATVITRVDVSKH